MLRRQYIRATPEDPGRNVGTIERFSEGTNFEPGHRRQVRICRPFEEIVKAWYDRLRGVFFVDGKAVDGVTHWERLVPVVRRKPFQGHQP